MNLYLFFALLGGLLVLAFVANRLVRFTGVPDVIILMLTGVLIGPVFHVVNPDLFRGGTHGFGTLALLLILFEGGMDLRLREVVSQLAGGLFLAFVCFSLTLFCVALVCKYLLQIDWISSLLIGSALGCTSSSIVLPVLQQVKLRKEVQITLLVEASLGDALAVLAVNSLLTTSGAGSTAPPFVIWMLVSSLIIGVGAGVLGGMFWSYLLPMLSEVRFWHVLTFAAVLLLYSGVHVLQGNELVAVLVFGITIANFPALRNRAHIAGSVGRMVWPPESPLPAASSAEGQRHDEMLTFHGELAFLLRTFFFVLLGTRVELSGVSRNVVLAVACVAALFIARYFTIQVGRLIWRGFTSFERELMVWFLPRGLITAVLGIEIFQARGAKFQFVPSLAFAVILLTSGLLLIGTIRARSRAPIESSASGAPVAENAIKTN